MGTGREEGGVDRLVIPYARQSIGEDDVDAVVETLRSDFLTQGPRIGYFEDALCELTGAKYAVAVGSGTAALHLSCLGLGVAAGDTGVVPAITFAATANCLRYVGANVRFCDVDSLSGHATVGDFRNALSQARECGERVRVLLPVSYGGRVVDLEEIAEGARKDDIFVIEDAAHSIGATYERGGHLFSSASCRHSDAAILSFHPVKHICAGEGGAVLTNDEVLAKRVRSLRSHGIDRTLVEGRPDRWLYEQNELGFHYRMTELQAALGGSQLKKLDRFIARRREIAQHYTESFSDLVINGDLRTPEMDAGCSWHLYVVHFKNEDVRMRAYDFLQENGVRVQVHYIPVYHHPYYSDGRHALCEGAEAFYRGCLSLPMFPDLKSSEQERVISLVREFLSL